MINNLAAASSTPLIDWASLGKVAAASAVFGIAIAAVFAVGILCISVARPNETSQSDSGAIKPGALSVAGAGVCFALCTAAVAYGLWIIIPQFHR